MPPQQLAELRRSMTNTFLDSNFYFSFPSTISTYLAKCLTQKCYRCENKTCLAEYSNICQDI